MAETRSGGVYKTSDGRWVDANGQPTDQPSADESKQRQRDEQQATANETGFVQQQLAALQAQIARLTGQQPATEQQQPTEQPASAETRAQADASAPGATDVSAETPAAPTVPRRERK